MCNPCPHEREADNKQMLYYTQEDEKGIFESKKIIFSGEVGGISLKKRHPNGDLKKEKYLAIQRLGVLVWGRAKTKSQEKEPGMFSWPGLEKGRNVVGMRLEKQEAR